MNRDMGSQINDKAYNEAADWHALLGGDAANEQDWLTFTQWLEADESHRLAYDAIEDILIDLNDNQDDLTIPVENIPTDTVVNARHRWSKKGKWIGVAVAAAATIFIAFGTGIFQQRDNNILEYVTQNDEQRVVTLDDGSTIKLNANSKVSVSFNDDIRQTELEYGQGIFRVAKNEPRPFQVNLGDSQVLVTGTVFDITRDQEKTRIAVAEGSVKVSATNPKSNQMPVTLNPGAVLKHQRNMTNLEVTTIDPETVLSWEEGYLEYDNALLDVVVSDLNRYFENKIQVLGDARTLRFSGIVRTDDKKNALLVLSESLAIKIEHRNGEILISLKD